MKIKCQVCKKKFEEEEMLFCVECGDDICTDCTFSPDPEEFGEAAAISDYCPKCYTEKFNYLLWVVTWTDPGKRSRKEFAVTKDFDDTTIRRLGEHFLAIHPHAKIRVEKYEYRPSRSEAESIRSNVQKGLMWSMEGYNLDDLINDCNLTKDQKSWAKYNLAVTIKIV